MSSAGNFYKFCTDLATEEMSKSQQMGVLLGGLARSKKDVDVFKTRSELIDRLQKELNADKITVDDFLQQITCPSNTGVDVYRNVFVEPQEVPDADQYEDEDETDTLACLMCKQEVRLVVMVPCMHQTICPQCLLLSIPNTCIWANCGADVTTTLTVRK